MFEPRGRHSPESHEGPDARWRLWGPHRQTMKLAEKLLHHAGKTPAGAGAARDRPAETAARPIAAPANDAGGVLTFGDVASAREGARGAATPAETAAAAARWSAGAIKRVGSVKFAAPVRGAGRGAGGAQVEKHDADNKTGTKNRSTPPGARHSDFPSDWTLKTHVKFTSTVPLRWAAASSGGPAAADGGIRAFVGARPIADPDAFGDDDDENAFGFVPPLPVRERVHRALLHWTYPSEPMEPELIAALKKHPGTSGKRWLENRLEDGWREALLGAYAALRLGQCPVFYVVYAERVILFCEPGVGGVTTASNNGKDTGKATERLGFAIVTDAASGKFRDALLLAKVPHVCVGHDPLSKSKKTGRMGFTGLLRKTGADGDGRGHGGAYGHGIPLEEWALEDGGVGGDIAYDDEDDFSALDAHGRPMLRSPERLARLNAGAGAEKDARAADAAVVCIGSAAVHALVCLLTESASVRIAFPKFVRHTVCQHKTLTTFLLKSQTTAGDPAGAASASRDAPLILAPAPFAGATLRRIELKVSRAEATFDVEEERADSDSDAGGDDPEVPGEKRRRDQNGKGPPKREKRTLYVAECVSSGGWPIPPWCVSRLTEALCDEQAENLVGNCKALGTTAALNAAVGAIRGKGDDGDDREDDDDENENEPLPPLGAETFYTRRERKRARRFVKLGTKGVEKVERFGGEWYVNPSAAKKPR